jgi:hypothetical protein
MTTPPFHLRPDDEARIYLWLFALVLLTLLNGCATAPQVFTGAPMPQQAVAQAKATVTPIANKNAIMANVATNTPVWHATNGVPFSLAADFAPTQLTNLSAFIDARTNLRSGSWVRQSAPYPTNGGALYVPWTNIPVFFRAGYETR